MASKPMQRSLEELRDRGYTAHVVEKTIPHSFIKQDFGGYADILAYKIGEQGVLAVQACEDNGGGVSNHVKKLTTILPEEIADPKRSEKARRRLDNIWTWISAGNRLEVWGWGKKGERGKRKSWVLRIVRLELPVRLPGQSVNGFVEEIKQEI